MASTFCKVIPFVFLLFLTGCTTTPPEGRIDDRVRVDDRVWERRTTRQPEIHFSKMVPATQSFHSWEERIELARIPVSISDATIRSFKERRKYELFKECPGGTWNLIQNGNNLVIYEFEHRKCDPYEHRLVVMKREENRGTLFVYRTRRPMDSEKKSYWIEIGKDASNWSRK